MFLITSQDRGIICVKCTEVGCLDEIPMDPERVGCLALTMAEAERVKLNLPQSVYIASSVEVILERLRAAGFKVDPRRAQPGFCVADSMIWVGSVRLEMRQTLAATDTIL